MANQKTSHISRWKRTSESARERLFGWRRKAATVGVGLLAIAMGYGVVFGHNGLTSFMHKRQEARSLQKQAQLLQTENDRLQGHVERLQNDPAAIEHQAREELHYTRGGEVIVDLPGAHTARSTQTVPNQ